MMMVMMMIMMGIAVIVDGRPTAQEDMQMNCPSHCVCKLFPMPGVYCSGYMSLPGVIPRSARLFNCTGCNIVRITNKSLENYRHLTHLILAGSSRLLIDSLSPQFLRGVQYLELEGYEISQNDILRLIADNRTLVLKNISLTFSNASVPFADTPAAGVSSKSPTSSVEEDGLVTKEGAVGSPSVPATAEGGDIDTFPSEAGQDGDATPVSQAPEEKPHFSESNYCFPTWILVIALLLYVVMAAGVIAWWCKTSNRCRRDYEQVALEDASKKSENVLVPASNYFPTDFFVVKVPQSHCLGCSRSTCPGVFFTAKNDAEDILPVGSPTGIQHVRALPSVIGTSYPEGDEETLRVVSNKYENSSGNKYYIAIPCVIQKGKPNIATFSFNIDRPAVISLGNANCHCISNPTMVSPVGDNLSQEQHNKPERLDCADECIPNGSDVNPRATLLTKIDKSVGSSNKIKTNLEQEISECGNVTADDLEPDGIDIKTDFLGNRPQRRYYCKDESDGGHNKPSYQQISNIIVNPIEVNNIYRDDNNGEINSACSLLIGTNYQSKLSIPNENQQSKFSDNDDRYKNRKTDCFIICDSTQDNPNIREIEPTDYKKCNDDNIKITVHQMSGNNYTPCSVAVDNNDNM